MTGLGTIINVGAILAGGIIGMLIGGALKERFQKMLISVCGLNTIFIGISGALEKMLSVDGNKISSGQSMMCIICFVLGSLVGELLNIDSALDRFGAYLKEKSGSQKDNSFVNAFVTASLTVCIGAMAIVGSIQDGLMGDYSVLAAKSVLDFIIVIVITASLGKGAIFSAIPVGILQGLVTLLSGTIAPLMTENALNSISLTGSIMIFCVGVNLIREKTFKVANMLPTLVFAVIWTYLPISL